MSEHHDWCARRKRLQIFFKPIELFRPQDTETAFADVHYIHQPNEVYTFPIETVPTRTKCFLREPFAVENPVVAKYIVFTRYVKNFSGLDCFQILLESVEFFRFGQVAQVASV